MAISPEQFNKLATKEDLNELREELASKEDAHKVLSSVDGLAKRFDTIETEFKMDKIAHDRIQKDVDDIKEKLELKTAS